jgi:hypothetical protein
VTSKDEITVCATLQALRWRVTRVSTHLKRQTLHAFSHFDILDCVELAGAIQMEKTVFDMLYFSDSLRIREFTMSFLNALSSEYLGRSYLL